MVPESRKDLIMESLAPSSSWESTGRMEDGLSGTDEGQSGQESEFSQANQGPRVRRLLSRAQKRLSAQHSSYRKKRISPL